MFSSAPREAKWPKDEAVKEAFARLECVEVRAKSTVHTKSVLHHARGIVHIYSLVSCTQSSNHRELESHAFI